MEAPSPWLAIVECGDKVFYAAACWLFGRGRRAARPDGSAWLKNFHAADVRRHAFPSALPMGRFRFMLLAADAQFRWFEDTTLSGGTLYEEDAGADDGAGADGFAPRTVALA